MGQGYSVIHPSAGSAGIDAPEVSDLEYERTLPGARFLKTIRARHKDGVVVVKVYTKPFSSLKLDDHIRQLIDERTRLAGVPNALPYHRVLETNTSAYLVRQHVHSSLYDRISTNPPLEDIERKWIAFQLLSAVRDCHARNIYHGDIKTENMLLTSWNWLYLTDFAASIKPRFLPEDNPVDFSLFYDTTIRRICYIAPERFSATTSSDDAQPQKDLQWAMDIFSVGCVIAELFTEKPTFTLSQLFRYRKGDFDPAQTTLTTIKDDSIREMVSHMISLDPDDRYSAQEYLDFWKEKAFPTYFYDFLHQYTHLITDPTSGQKAVELGESNSGGSDDRIDRICADYDKIVYALGLETDNSADDTRDLCNTLQLNLFPLQVHLAETRHKMTNRASTSDNGALLFTNIVIASLRSTARASSKLKACELLLTFTEHLTDEAKLDRVLPYAVALLEDPVASVRIAALRTITQLLSLVKALSPMNAFIFPRYILPRLAKFVSGPAFTEEPPLRATYAACIADLATTALRFLDMTQALRADGSLPSIDPEAEDDAAAYAAYQISYDVTKEELVQQFEAQTKLLLTDEDASVRRAFLGSVGSLCVFFGDALASDLLLSHLNTYLNDDDWTLRCALCEVMTGIAAFVGPAQSEDFLLPLLVQALTDPEETVTEQVIRSCASMVNLGLFQKWIMLELVVIIARFAIHPNHWIREATAQFIASTSSHLSYAEFRSLIEPLIRPILKIDIADTSETAILDALKKPLSRPVFDLVKAWAARSDKGVFWQTAQKAQSLSFGAANNRALIDLYSRTGEVIEKIAKNPEDDQWMTRLRNAGMRSEDEVKLVALRDYIWRTVKRTDKETITGESSTLNTIISLTSITVPLQNVLFEEDSRYYDQIVGRQASAPRTPASSQTLREDSIRNSSTATSDARPPQSTIRSDLTNSKISDASQRTIRAPSTPLKVNDRLAAGRSSNANDTILSSSPATSHQSEDDRSQRSARLRENAIGLMKRADPGKAGADVGTDSANAQGRMDVPTSGRGTPINGQTGSTSTKTPRDIKDPNLRHYLEHNYASNYPIDLNEFGPKVQSHSRTQVANAPGQTAAGRWRPQGLLVASLNEHTDQITCLAVSPDHVFFLTGSKDGTVRVWDTSRLENNVTHRAKQTYHHTSEAAITALTFVESTHTFISCAEDGSLNVVKIEIDNQETDKSVRYGKLAVLRDWDLTLHFPEQPLAADVGNEKEHVVALEHTRSDGTSLCYLLTSRGRFVALDLRHMEVLYSFTNPAGHGPTTSFCVHKRRQWLLIGTTHGVIDLWDLRFQLRLRAWTFRKPVAITKLALHPGRRSSHSMRICMAGGTGPGQFSIWHLEKMTCGELYCIQADPAAPKPTNREVEAVLIEDDNNVQQLERFVAGTNDAGIGPLSGASSAESPRSTASHKTPISSPVRDFVLQMHIPSDNQTSANDAKHHFLITAGPDWKTRFWDADKPSSSMLVNEGAMPSHGATNEDKTMQVSATLIGADTKIYTDSGPADGAEEASPTPAGKTSRRVSRSVSTTSVAAAKAAKPKQSRYDVVRNSAQHLLRGHRDEITCVALIEKPFGMVVTGDRSGAVHVFQ